MLASPTPACGPLGLPADRGSTAVAATHGTTCAIQANYSLTCWGKNARAFTAALGGTSLTLAAAGGDSFVCALRTDASVTCTGTTTYNGLPLPLTPSAGVNARSLTASANHLCVLLLSGRGACVGLNRHGQVAGAALLARLAATDNAEVAAGGVHTCVRTTRGAVSCYGDTSDGRGAVPAGVTFASLSAGYHHSCGIACNGTLFCWGANTYSQVRPFPDFGGASVAAVAAGGWHTLVLLRGGAVLCFGRSQWAQCSVPAAAQSGVAAISAGFQHSCCVFANGTSMCWGQSVSGEVTGQPASLTRVPPALLPPLTPPLGSSPTRTPTSMRTLSPTQTRTATRTRKPKR